MRIRLHPRCPLRPCSRSCPSPLDIGGDIEKWRHWTLVALSSTLGWKGGCRFTCAWTRMLTGIEASYMPFVHKSESLVIRLDKALYGCVESAALSHEHFFQTLAPMGYERNAYYSCVYYRTVRGIQQGRTDELVGEMKTAAIHCCMCPLTHSQAHLSYCG